MTGGMWLGNCLDLRSICSVNLTRASLSGRPSPLSSPSILADCHTRRPRCMFHLRTLLAAASCSLWSLLCLLLAMASLSPHSSTSAHPPFLFLGFQHQQQLLQSSIEFSFEKYRLELSGLMQTLSSPLSQRVMSSPHTPIIRSIVSRFHSDINQFPPRWEENELFLRRLLQRKVPFVYCISDDSEEVPPPPHQISSYDSFHQLLIHLERDWGEGGKAVRRTIYTEGILPLLGRYLDPGPNVKILVPGAGLGRLAVELAASGYR